MSRCLSLALRYSASFAWVVGVLTSVAYGQVSPAWVDEQVVTGALAHTDHRAFSTAGGDVVTITAVASVGLGINPTELVVRRLDSNGSTLMQSTVSIVAQDPIDPFTAARIDYDVGLNGNSVVAVQLGDEMEVLYFGTDTVLDWRQRLSASTVTRRLRAQRVALAPNGDVVLVGLESPATSSGGSPLNALLFRLDLAGNLIHLRQQSATFSADARVTDAGELVGLFESVGQDSRLVRYNALGVPLWSTTMNGIGIGSLFEINGAGAARMNYRVPGTSDGRLVAFDPSGAFQWDVSVAPVVNAEDMSMDDAGSTLLLSSSNDVLRISSTGAIAWQVSLPPLVWFRWSALTPDAYGNAILYWSDSDGAGTPTYYGVDVLDATGAQVGSARLPDLGSLVEGLASLEASPNGAIIVASLSLSPSSPSFFDSVRTDKLVLGLPGSPYCAPGVPNSTGVGGELLLGGSNIVAENRLELLATSLPLGALTLFLASRTEAVVPGAGGSVGTLCLGGEIGRYVAPGEVRPASAQGTTSLSIDLLAMPQPTGLVPAISGEVWRFQLWHRDANPVATSNFTSAVRVVLL